MEAIDMRLRAVEAEGAKADARRKVKDGAEQVGLTDAATRILAAVRRLEASAIDPEVLAASIARHLPAGVDANRIAADVAADLIARLKA